MRQPGSSDRFVALLLLGVLAFSPPLLSIFSVRELVFGIPILYLYLFVAWGVLIALLARISLRAAAPERPDPDAG
jgi:hypothetical protein